jgi:hypothetical protein
MVIAHELDALRPLRSPPAAPRLPPEPALRPDPGQRPELHHRRPALDGLRLHRAHAMAGHLPQAGRDRRQEATRRVASPRGGCATGRSCSTGCVVRSRSRSRVHVVRNPLDNIASMKLRRDAPLESVAEQYLGLCDAMAELRRRFAADELAEVRYEDLVAHPRTALRSLAGFLEGGCGPGLGRGGRGGGGRPPEPQPRQAHVDGGAGPRDRARNRSPRVPRRLGVRDMTGRRRLVIGLVAVAVLKSAIIPVGIWLSGRSLRCPPADSPGDGPARQRLPGGCAHERLHLRPQRRRLHRLPLQHPLPIRVREGPAWAGTNPAATHLCIVGGTVIGGCPEFRGTSAAARW